MQVAPELVSMLYKKDGWHPLCPSVQFTSIFHSFVNVFWVADKFIFGLILSQGMIEELVTFMFVLLWGPTFPALSIAQTLRVYVLPSILLPCMFKDIWPELDVPSLL